MCRGFGCRETGGWPTLATSPAYVRPALETRRRHRCGRGSCADDVAARMGDSRCQLVEEVIAVAQRAEHAHGREAARRGLAHAHDAARSHRVAPAAGRSPTARARRSRRRARSCDIRRITTVTSSQRGDRVEHVDPRRRRRAGRRGGCTAMRSSPGSAAPSIGSRCTPVARERPRIAKMPRDRHADDDGDDQVDRDRRRPRSRRRRSHPRGWSAGSSARWRRCTMRDGGDHEHTRERRERDRADRPRCHAAPTSSSTIAWKIAATLAWRRPAR